MLLNVQLTSNFPRSNFCNIINKLFYVNYLNLKEKSTANEHFLKIIFIFYQFNIQNKLITKSPNTTFLQYLFFLVCLFTDFLSIAARSKNAKIYTRFIY